VDFLPAQLFETVCFAPSRRQRRVDKRADILKRGFGFEAVSTGDANVAKREQLQGLRAILHNVFGLRLPAVDNEHQPLRVH
jgi:hypothetical protein